MSYYSDGAGYEEAQLAQFCFLHHTQSKAQLMQDLLVLFLTNRKKNGYFVEFGASNGVTLSNTMLLEELYGWTGILAEPARGWHKELQIYRQCIIDTRCVTDRSGDQVLFNETPDKFTPRSMAIQLVMITTNDGSVASATRWIPFRSTIFWIVTARRRISTICRSIQKGRSF
jgi:hypothetical protein